MESTQPARGQHKVFADSKNRFEILDGLRGVAALTVVVFHLLEAFSEGNHAKQLINHGYLAVDFFFLLSGFVIGYAYDDRWGTMSLGDFFKRRLIRLHPMIIMGMVIGAICFYPSASPLLFPHIQDTSWWALLLTFLLGCTLLPMPLSMDIRGWTEMHPLNGPAWSLFFEYIANILYALFLRRISKTLLSVLTLIAGAALVHLAVTGPNGDVIGGWSLDPVQFKIGSIRMAFPFLAGLLLCRTVKLGTVPNAFFWCSVLILLALAFPRVGGSEKLWLNGIYDSVCIILLFPLIVYLGASGKIEGKGAAKVCQFLGDISYPIYIIHYPLIYVYTAWAVNNKWTLTSSTALWAGLGVFVLSVAIAYACLVFYDLPVRKWLTKYFSGV